MKNQQPAPAIYFKSYEVKEFKYKKKAERKEFKNENPFQISVNPGYDETKEKAVIEVTVNLDTEAVSITIVVNGYFELVDGAKTDFEKYLVINGTAIVYPYVRSMVSMLTSLDNENAIILPTINTNGLWHE